MTIIEAIQVLKHHHYWRLGATIEPFEPKVITEAFKVIIKHYELYKE
jgi:hypothetical protein